MTILGASVLFLKINSLCSLEVLIKFEDIVFFSNSFCFWIISDYFILNPFPSSSFNSRLIFYAFVSYPSLTCIAIYDIFTEKTSDFYLYGENSSSFLVAFWKVSLFLLFWESSESSDSFYEILILLRILWLTEFGLKLISVELMKCFIIDSD